MSTVWPWVAVALLGCYHGIDPSMGWLFAVSLGLQEKRRSKVLWALVPLAIGHLISIAAFVALIGWLQVVTASSYLRPTGAVLLILFGIYRLVRGHTHPRWVKMRVNSWQLGLWSFLMASAHGAGLMLFPILMDVMPTGSSALAHHHHHVPIVAHTLFEGAAVVLLHVTAMVIVMGTVALLVFEKFGLAILRSAWINLDYIWDGALIAAGIISFFV